MEKLLLTAGAFKGEMALVGLQMIVHGILIFLRGLADTAYKFSCRVLLVDIWHGSS